MSAATINEARARLRELREEYASAKHDKAPIQWARMSVEVRVLLLTFAGIDAAQDHELVDLARKDWREFTPREQQAIKETGAYIRWQLQGARELFL